MTDWIIVTKASVVVVLSSRPTSPSDKDAPRSDTDDTAKQAPDNSPIQSEPSGVHLCPSALESEIRMIPKMLAMIARRAGKVSVSPSRIMPTSAA